MSDNLTIIFQKAINYIKLELARKQFPNSPEISNEHKLQFYGLYKVITENSNNKPAPNILNLVAFAKWQAWKKVSHLSKHDAMLNYIKLLNKVAPQWEYFYNKHVMKK